MGMDAELLAIGKFSKELADFLEYPKEFYDDTPEGAIVITSVLVCNTSRASRALAKALKVSPWNFGEHCELDGVDINEDLLLEDSVDGEDAVLSFRALRDHGFKFYYRPNG